MIVALLLSFAYLREFASRVVFLMHNWFLWAPSPHPDELFHVSTNVSDKRSELD